MKSAEEKAREDMRRSQDIACAHDICVALKELEAVRDERATDEPRAGANAPRDCRP